jgi:hypothetical protein
MRLGIADLVAGFQREWLVSQSHGFSSCRYLQNQLLRSDLDRLKFVLGVERSRVFVNRIYDDEPAAGDLRGPCKATDCVYE